MFEKLKSVFGKKKPKPTPKKKSEPKLSDKEVATRAGEPWVNIIKVNVDPNDINNGAFELDWNDKFLLNLIKQGYKQKEEDKDEQIVDRWFQTVCRNIALEVYEQDQADPQNRGADIDPITGAEMRVVQSKDLGDGRSEVS
jgi:predicted restriction endonuclease